MGKIPPDPRLELIESIYREARDETVFGRPVMELQPDRVSVDNKGRVFADLRAVIDQLELWLMKSPKQPD